MKLFLNFVMWRLLLPIILIVAGINFGKFIAIILIKFIDYFNIMPILEKIGEAVVL